MKKKLRVKVRKKRLGVKVRRQARRLKRSPKRRIEKLPRSRSWPSSISGSPGPMRNAVGRRRRFPNRATAGLPR